MRATLQRFHVYAGLQSAVGILVYGLTSVCASLAGPIGAPTTPEIERRALAVDVKADAEPKAVAKAVARSLAFPLAQGPWEVIQEGAVVSMMFGSPNAARTVHYDRDRREVVIETSPVPLSKFAIGMHQARIRSGMPGRKLLWAAFNMVSAAALLFMVATGLYLFVTAKKKPWYGWAALAIGVLTLAPFLVLLK